MEYLGPCEIKKNPPHTIKNAGINVGLDLENPIDCSQMDVYQISSEMDYGNNYYDHLEVKRTTVLHAFIFNEHGEREELTITFELKSLRTPKLIKEE